MSLFGNPGARAERERQLVELLQAVQNAQQVARSMCNSPGSDNEAKLLFGRLEAVRLEVEQLRRSNGTTPFKEIDPKWTGRFLWRMVPEC